MLYTLVNCVMIINSDQKWVNLVPSTYGFVLMCRFTRSGSKLGSNGSPCIYVLKSAIHSFSTHLRVNRVQVFMDKD